MVLGDGLYQKLRAYPLATPTPAAEGDSVIIYGFVFVAGLLCGFVLWQMFGQK